MPMNGRNLAMAAVGCAALYWLSTRRRAAESFSGRVVVITGGTRGLGLEMPRLWVHEGARVAICARSQADVDEAVLELQQAGGVVLGMACDVTQQDQVLNFVNHILTMWGQIDVLVNNAGVIQVGPRESMSHADYEHALAVHFWGPFLMTEAVLPTMRSRRSGRIVNIASLGGRVSVPHLLPYSVSKCALTGWSEGLAAELAESGISVTTVTPGLMRTGSPRRADFKGQHRAEYAWFSMGASLPVITVNSQLAGRRIVEACRRGDAAASVSVVSALTSAAHGLSPDLVIRAMSLINRYLPKHRVGGEQTYKGWQSQSKWSPSWLTVLNEQAAIRNRQY